MRLRSVRLIIGSSLWLGKQNHAWKVFIRGEWWLRARSLIDVAGRRVCFRGVRRTRGLTSPQRAQVKLQSASVSPPKRLLKFSRQHELRPPAGASEWRLQPLRFRPMRAGNPSILYSVQTPEHLPVRQAAHELSTLVTNAAAKTTVRLCVLRDHFDTRAASVGLALRALGRCVRDT